jgi:signal transduction histidine kinase
MTDIPARRVPAAYVIADSRTSDIHSRFTGARLRTFVRDTFFALSVAAVELASLTGRVAQVRSADDAPVPFVEADGPGGLLVLLGSLPLIFRRQAPMAVLAITGLALALTESLGYAPPPLPFAVLLAIYTVTSTTTYLGAMLITAAAVVGVAIVAMAHRNTFTDDKVLAYLVSLGVVWGLGHMVRISRNRALEQERLAFLRLREQQERQQLTVEQERRVIARELHDLVTHTVCLTIRHAESARRSLPAEPTVTRQALSAIEESSRETLAELRQLLRTVDATGSNRGNDTPDGDTGVVLPRLDRLPELITQMGQAGLFVDLTIRGQPQRLTPRVELSAYRIVQEALTNIARHAVVDRARVLLDYRTGVLVVRVVDNGEHVPVALPGRGLIGMRERAALLGGRLTIRSGTVKGFHVIATLPTEHRR